MALYICLLCSVFIVSVPELVNCASVLWGLCITRFSVLVPLRGIIWTWLCAMTNTTSHHQNLPIHTEFTPITSTQALLHVSISRIHHCQISPCSISPLPPFTPNLSSTSVSLGGTTPSCSTQIVCRYPAKNI